MRTIRYLRKGLINHPGTLPIIIFSIAGYSTAYAFWGMFVVLVLFGPLYLWSAYQIGKHRNVIDLPDPRKLMIKCDQCDIPGYKREWDDKKHLSFPSKKCWGCNGAGYIFKEVNHRKRAIDATKRRNAS